MPTYITESHYNILEKYFDLKRRRKYSIPEILNAILFLVDNGLKWRSLYVLNIPYQLVFYYFRKWTLDGSLDGMQKELLEQARLAAGRESAPTVCIIDSQSVKNDAFVSDDVGIDGNKKVRGRKRHIAIDTQGNLLDVVVTAANEHDGIQGCSLIKDVLARYPSIELVFADGGYAGQFVTFVENQCKKMVEIVPKAVGTGFKVIKRRWKVEQAIANLGNNRRLAKDYEKLIASSEIMLVLSSIILLINRIL